MAVEHYKATAITNRDSTPKVLTNANISKGVLLEAVGTVETVDADSIDSTYRFASVPSNARISQILLYSDDIGTTTAADFGLYKTTADGGAVVDADLFADGVSLKDGALSAVDITHESAVFGLEDAEKPLWSALGLSADPCIYYDVTATLTAAADAAGTITVKVRYVI
jgi:hypothetical protein